MAEPALIADAGGLAALCDRLRRRDGGWLAVDTEFVRERTYFPQLCLIQLADGEQAYCIDPLALEPAALEPLRNLLSDTARVKVLHAGQQDLEILYRLWGEVPAPLFDTQVAATLLGHGEQVSYAVLVQRVLDVRLDKAHTRTDWAQRPLSAEQLQYAAEDVLHLHRLYPLLREDLRSRGRLDWLSGDFAALADPQRYRPDSAQAWRRIKGGYKLRGPKLLALQRLAGWRERQAIERDMPKRWLLADDALIALAQQLPADPAALARVRGLNERSVARYGRDWLALCAEVRATPRARWPEPPERGDRLSMAQEALLDALGALVKLRADEQAISPATLAGRRDLEALLAGAASPVLQGWRRVLVGDDLRALLDGGLTLQVRDGRLRALAGDRGGR